jgi:hypothetical protein
VRSRRAYDNVLWCAKCMDVTAHYRKRCVTCGSEHYDPAPPLVPKWVRETAIAVWLVVMLLGLWVAVR